MTKRRSTKRALLSSVVALLLCFTMLLGSTFAWFTDSAASGSNVIKAGNLDIVVEYTLDGETWNDLDGAIDLFQKGLWEPGHTEVVALRIKNNGTLALKYAANMNILSESVGETKDGADIVLSDILTVSTLIQQAVDADGNANQIGDITLGLAFSGENSVAYENTTTFKAGNVLGNDVQLFPDAAHYVIVKVDMDETVGNEANHNGTDIPKINFGMNVLATQFTYENDSFDNQYDEDAEYPVVENPIVIPDDAIDVETLEELTTALRNGGKYVLGGDINVDSNLSVASNTVLYGTEETVLTFRNNSKITVDADTSLDIYGVQMNGEGTYSFAEDGSIDYDANARRTTPLLNTGAGSTLVLGQGTVIENVVAQGSAVVSANGTADNRTKVILDGATIQNCAGESGTIINVNKAGDVVIEEGTVISGNASYNNNNHGIIRVYNAWDAENPSTVTMNGGEISGNYYSGNGLIGLYYGKMIMNGGEICDNAWFEDNQKHNGFYPVVYAHSNSQFVMNDGEISGNSVRFGVLNCLNSAIEPAIIINGGTVQNNTNTDNDTDAFAAALIEKEGKKYKSISVSENANVMGFVWDYYTGYYTLEDYFAKIN